MKLSIVLAVSGMALAYANEHRGMRGFGRGGGGLGGRGGGRGGGGRGGAGGMMVRGNCYWGADEGEPLFDRIEDECEKVTCSEVDTEELGCDAPTWDTLDENETYRLFEGCPEEGLTDVQKEEIRDKMQEKREEWRALTPEQRADIRQQRAEIREANAATVLGCGCCGGPDTISSLNSIEDLVKGKEGLVAKTLGFRKPRGEGGHGFGGHGHGYGGGPGAGQGNGGE